MPEYHDLSTDYKLARFVERVQMKKMRGEPLTVEFKEPPRSTDQNSHFYALYGRIAAHLGDKTTLEVKRECKLHYGIGILKAGDPEFSTFYDQAIKGMSYEDKLVLMTYFDVTSKFTKAQATEYITDIKREYSAFGVVFDE